jgi:ribosomal-protein-alanine N-acetyltransferase
MAGRILIDEKIRTGRLLLRSRIFDDNAFVFEASRYEGFNDGMPWDPPASIEEMYDRYHATLEKWVRGEAYSFVIVDRESEQRVGMISIRKTERDGAWDIGYWTHPELQNRGYMREAVKAILEFGFARLGARSIEAKYATWNVKSERVLLRNGMRFAEFLERGFEKHGAWVQENRVEITREEWKKTQ